MDYTDSPGDAADPWYTEDFEATWQDVSDRYFPDIQNDLDISSLKMSMEKEIAEIRPYAAEV